MTRDATRRRVLYVMHNAAPGGAGNSLRHLAEHLPYRYEPHVACPEGPARAPLERSGIPVHDLPAVSMLLSNTAAPLTGRRLAYLGRSAWHARHGRRFARILDRLRPDLVHLNEIGMIQAARIAARRRIPVVMHARGVADPDATLPRRILDSLVRRYADRVIAIDESVRRSLGAIPGIDVVYNPLPARPTTPAHVPAGTDPATGRTITRVTYLGNLLPYKGVWDLLESARLLRDRTDIRFLLVGGNSRPDAFYSSLAARLVQPFGFGRDVRSEMVAWVREAGLADSVELPGHVGDIDAVLGSTDVLVFPSHLDGVGRSVFEAGSLGIPSVVTLRHRVEDIVEDGVTGLLLPERDPVALAEGIAWLADHPEERRRMGAEARRRYPRQFDPDRVATMVASIYDTVLDNNRRAGPAPPRRSDF